MIKISTPAIWLLAMTLLLPGSRVMAASALFDQLLQESGVQLTLSGAFSEIAPRDNPLLNYEKAFVAEDNTLEIRVVLRPLRRLTISYEDPHNAAPEPNHIFPLIFDSMIGTLAKAGHMPSREYPDQQAKSLFNADWAAAAVFDVEPDFATDFEQALLVALHRNNRADVYVIFLFDDFDQVRDQVKANLSSLRFVTP